MYPFAAVLSGGKISSRQFLFNLVANPKGIALKALFIGRHLEGGRWKLKMDEVLQTITDRLKLNLSESNSP